MTAAEWGFTPQEDARLVIRHRAREAKQVAVAAESMGEKAEAQRLVLTVLWMEWAAEQIQNAPADLANDLIARVQKERP